MLIKKSWTEMCLVKNNFIQRKSQAAVIILHSCANGLERRFSHFRVMYTSEKSKSSTKNYYVTSNSRTFADRTKHRSIWTDFGSGEGGCIQKFKCRKSSSGGGNVEDSNWIKTFGGNANNACAFSQPTIFWFL